MIHDDESFKIGKNHGDHRDSASVISLDVIYATRHSVVVIAPSAILDVLVDPTGKVTIIKDIKYTLRHPGQL